MSSVRGFSTACVIASAMLAWLAYRAALGGSFPSVLAWALLGGCTGQAWRMWNSGIRKAKDSERRRLGRFAVAGSVVASLCCIGSLVPSVTAIHAAFVAAAVLAFGASMSVVVLRGRST